MTSTQLTTIGEVARRAGLRVSAIRFYEHAGLLRPPRRANGRRVYDESVFEELALIRLAQSAGFTIRDIQQLLVGFDAATPASTRWQVLARRKLKETEESIARAQRMRDLLRKAVHCRCDTLAMCVRKHNAAMAGTPIDMNHG